MKKYLIIIASIFVLSGCSIVNVSTDYDEKVDFTIYKKYAIIKFSQGDSIINNRVEKAIKDELSSRLYELVDEAKADFIVLYRYTAKDKTRTTTEYVGGGYGRFGMYGGYGGFYTTSTYNYTEGNFEIRMANPNNKESFWRAEGVNTLKSKDTPSERTDYTNKIVHKMLEKYPKLR